MNFITKLVFFLGLGLSTMALPQVERTDTFETQRQKINELSLALGNIDKDVNSPSNSQYIREDFNYWDGFGDAVLGGQPSIYFRQQFHDLGTGTPSHGSQVYLGYYNSTISPLAIGNDQSARLYGALGRSPYKVNQYRTFETAVAIASGTATPLPKMFTAIGFMTDYADPRASVGVFFEISSPGGANTVGSPVTPSIRAVVVNNQLPTPAVIFDQVIANVFTQTMYVPDDEDTVFTVYKIHLTNTEATFFINGTQVAQFASSLFGTSWDYVPQIQTRADGTGFLGEVKTKTDFIAIKSSVSR